VLGAVEPHAPLPHPQAPKDVIPTPVTDFKRYRANAQQHGPLARAGHYPSRQANLNKPDDSVNPGVALDRNELPERFRRMVLTAEEIEAIDVLPLLDDQANDSDRRG
jgi:small subunit ribosomal protein YMR-31